jgi:hypothetical protein
VCHVKNYLHNITLIKIQPTKIPIALSHRERIKKYWGFKYRDNTFTNSSYLSTLSPSIIIFWNWLNFFHPKLQLDQRTPELAKKHPENILKLGKTTAMYMSRDISYKMLKSKCLRFLHFKHSTCF